MKHQRTSKDKWKDIVALYKSGMTQAQIGLEYGVSYARIQKILKKCSIDSFLGGASLVAFDKKRSSLETARKLRDERVFETYKCTYQEALELNENKKISDPSGFAKKYLQQKLHAKQRGIEFLISFHDWVAFWKDSGRLASRGRGKGYCMGRIADQGAYELGNIYICTIGENFSHSYISKPWHERHASRITNNSTKGAE